MNANTTTDLIKQELATPQKSIKDANVDELKEMIVKKMFYDKDNLVMMNSMCIAEHFNKQHKHVLQKIDDVIQSLVLIGKNIEEIGRTTFCPSSYINNQNKKQPCYNLTFDAFNLLIGSFTGKYAFKYNYAYQEAFKLMTEKTKELVQRLPSYQINDEIERADAWKKEKLIERQKLLEQSDRADIAELQVIEQKELVEHTTSERDEAIKEKAHIGSKRESTSMNRLKKEKRENSGLRAMNEQLKNDPHSKNKLHTTGDVARKMGTSAVKLNKELKRLDYQIKELDDSWHPTKKMKKDWYKDLYYNKNGADRYYYKWTNKGMIEIICELTK